MCTERLITSNGQIHLESGLFFFESFSFIKACLSSAYMNLALKLTVFRISGSIFVLCFIKTAEQPQLLWAALALAFISELSDLLDGIIARRRYNMVTDLGKVLDPLADSISRLSIFLAFFQMGHANIWMILIFFYRDSLVSTLRIVAASRSLILSARKAAKLKLWFKQFLYLESF